ncbi:MAG TPA: hypothetical protein VIL20_29535 [Sandaracinaceae bacterium]
MRPALRAIAMMALLGCGAPPCASSIACGEGLVCGLDGRCGALDAPPGSRFAGSRWLEARDFGLATRDPSPLGDALGLGGPAGSEARLAFGPLPPPSRILRAVLVLHPWDPDARVDAPGEIVIEHVEPFRGGRRPARLSRTPAAFAAARRALPRGPARPVRIDLSALVAAAAGRADRTLYLLVRLEGGDPAGVRFASPWSPTSPGPRLELMLH